MGCIRLGCIRFYCGGMGWVALGLLRLSVVDGAALGWIGKGRVGMARNAMDFAGVYPPCRVGV